MEAQSKIAVVVLAVMGQNLAPNIARNGLPVTVYNRSFGKTEATIARWRRVVALGSDQGVPMLAMGGSLGYFDSFRRERLPQHLTQAQRDLFGATPLSAPTSPPASSSTTTGPTSRHLPSNNMRRL